MRRPGQYLVKIGCEPVNCGDAGRVRLLAGTRLWHHAVCGDAGSVHVEQWPALRVWSARVEARTPDRTCWWRTSNSSVRSRIRPYDQVLRWARIGDARVTGTRKLLAGGRGRRGGEPAAQG